MGGGYKIERSCFIHRSCITASMNGRAGQKEHAYLSPIGESQFVLYSTNYTLFNCMRSMCSYVFASVLILWIPSIFVKQQDQMHSESADYLFLAAELNIFPWRTLLLLLQCTFAQSFACFNCDFNCLLM